jgi:methylated-DNA-[protein]-cysteine S-methyltransferase
VNTEYQAVIATPLFALGLRCNADEIVAIDYLPRRAERLPTTPLAAEAVRQIRAYLADPRHIFTLPLQACGTPFQRRVREAIAAIPSGATMSYGMLAKAIHSAPRAVGGACGANPFPLVVPCHRVIAADGGLGGFGRNRESDGGFLLDIKRWLLAHEGALPPAG